MNIRELYKKEKSDATKVHHNHGGRGEFYGGDQIYTTGFKDKVVPFSGTGYKLNDEPQQEEEDIDTNYDQKTAKSGCCCFNLRSRKWFHK